MNQPVTQPESSTKQRRLITPFRTVMLILALLPFAIGYALYSENAAQWLVRLLQLRFAELEIAQVSGRLAGPLAVDGLRYRSNQNTFTADHIELDWQPAQLLFGRLHVDRLESRGLTIILPGDDQEKKSRRPLKLPFSIHAQDIALRETTLLVSTHAPIIIDNAEAHLRTAGDELIIDSLQATAFSPQAQLKAKLEASGVLPIDGRGSVHFQATAQAQIAERHLEAKLSARGSTRALQAEADLLSPIGIHIDIAAELEGRQPSWRAATQIEPFSLDQLIPSARALHLGAGTVAARGTGTHISGKAELSASDAEFGDWTLDADGAWDGKRWAIPRFLLANADEATRISGRINEDAKGAFDADLEWKEFFWPPRRNEGHARFASPSGQAHFTGSPQDYRYQAFGEVLPGAALPPVTLELTGSGNLEGMRADTVRGRWLQGDWQGKAEIAWKPAVHAHALADVTDIDLAELYPVMRGINIDSAQIEFDLKREPDASLDTSIDKENKSGFDILLETQISALRGQAFGRPLGGHGQAHATLAHRRIDINELVLAVGATEIKVAGSIAEQLHLNWQLQSSDLADAFTEVLPNISGTAQAEGTLGGPLAALHLATTLRARDLAWNNQHAERMALTAELDLDATRREAGSASLLESLRWRAEVEGAGLTSGEFEIGSATLRTQGSLAAHQLALDTDQDQLQFSQQLNGTVHDGHWQGTLEHGRLLQAKLGLWMQTAPAAFDISAGTTSSLQALCWESAGTTVCGHGTRVKDSDDDTLTGEIAWQGFELQRLSPLLPGDFVDITGASKGRITAARTGAAPPNVQLEVEANHGALHNTSSQQRMLQTLNYQRATLRADFGADGARATLALTLGETENIGATLALPGYVLGAPPAPEQAISGTLKASLDNLDTLALFIPDIMPVGAHASANLTLSGTVAAPLLGGEAAIGVERISVLRLGIQIEALNLALKAHGNALSLAGNAHIGDGELTLDGDGHFLSTSDWSAQLTVKGDSLEVVRLPTAHIKASPDITLRFAPGELQFDGKLTVPWARLEPVRPMEGSTVAISDDVVIIGGAPTPQRTPLNMKGRIEFVLGDDVRLNGRGFDGRLTGRALIVVSGADVTAQGEINFVDGRFQAYGQNLAITQGRFLYAGGSIDNPAIDIIASRTRGERDEIEVGVRILGTAHAPIVELYSSPAMDDTDVLSYLIIGRPISQARAGEGEDLYQAASSLAIAGGSALAKQIGERFNLVEISIQTGTQTQDTALVLGRALSPRLYVRYIRGLMDENNAIQFRYRLGNRWSIETESGTRTGAGADILYTLER
ncbi:MAG: translocation/assembly module TamB domain-containing protein [Chromatiales bacterium]|nr:translocation/assembly module TamB domain-containing protein [Chromatiales bacterium]